MSKGYHSKEYADCDIYTLLGIISFDLHISGKYSKLQIKFENTKRPLTFNGLWHLLQKISQSNDGSSFHSDCLVMFIKPSYYKSTWITFKWIKMLNIHRSFYLFMYVYHFACGNNYNVCIKNIIILKCYNSHWTWLLEINLVHWIFKSSSTYT